MSCQSLTVGLGLLVKPDYLPSLLSHKLQKLSTKPKLSSRFLQLSEWQVILDCPTSSNMDHHGMCVFCEDMQNGYTSSNIKTCFLNLLVFYPLYFYWVILQILSLSKLFHLPSENLRSVRKAKGRGQSGGRARWMCSVLWGFSTSQGSIPAELS